MSANRWAQMEQLCFALAAILLKRGVPLESVLLSESSSAAVDEWVRNYNRGRAEFVFPSDPLQQRELLGRLRAGGTAARVYKQQGLPSGSATAGEAGLEELLIDAWHGSFRDTWLRGGQNPFQN